MYCTCMTFLHVSRVISAIILLHVNYRIAVKSVWVTQGKNQLHSREKEASKIAYLLLFLDCPFLHPLTVWTVVFTACCCTCLIWATGGYYASSTPQRLWPKYVTPATSLAQVYRQHLVAVFTPLTSVWCRFGKILPTVTLFFLNSSSVRKHG